MVSCKAIQFFSCLLLQKICAPGTGHFFFLLLFSPFMTLFRTWRMFAMIRGFQQGLVISNCMQFRWVWGCGCGFCAWHNVSAKLVTVVCGCSDCSEISSPEIYYTLLFDVWRQTIYFLTYSFPFRLISCLKSSLLFPDLSLCFLFSALTVYSFPREKTFSNNNISNNYNLSFTYNFNRKYLIIKYMCIVSLKF